MSVELQILFAVVAAIGTVISGYWALARLVVAQFNRGLDQRFAAMAEARKIESRAADERLGRMEGNQSRLERELLELRADLPVEYVRREDHIRYETVVNAKLDALAAKIDLLSARQQERI